MVTYLAFSEHEGITRGRGLFEVIDTSMANYDDWIRPHVRGGLRRAGRLGSSYIDFPTPLVTGWCSFVLGMSSLSVTSSFHPNYPWAFFDQAGNIPVGLYTKTASRYVYLRAGWLGEDELINENILTQQLHYAFHWNIDDTNGFFRLYQDDVLVYEFEGDTTVGGAESLAGVENQTTSTNATSSWYGISEVIVDDDSLLGARLISGRLQTTGAVNDWTGNVGDVTGSGITVKGIFANVHDDTITREVNPMDTPVEGEAVRCVAITGMVRASETAVPQEVEAVARVGGTNYTTISQAVTLGITTQYHVFSENPATSQPWTGEQAAAAEFGLRAIDPTV